jgi:glycosyltransferase involved in cell wall biosynthesis
MTVSERSRLEILKWSGLKVEYVVNAGNGVDPVFQPDGACFDPGYPFILYVGNLRPHKNLSRLFAAFKQIDFPELRLLISAKKTSEIVAQLSCHGIENRVQFLGCIGDQQLAAVYRGALVLVLPSLIEGFGLPALEAMACGTPVVVSRTTALPEDTGEAGLFIDPNDPRDIRLVIERVLADAELRHAMRETGIRRAKLFSWGYVAARVRQVVDAARG